uniref:Uncharacterized protein n=1 Tax=Mustela putorius furo TaxID=9669 RepID=M3YEP2_MUSPF
MTPFLSMLVYSSMNMHKHKHRKPQTVGEREAGSPLKRESDVGLYPRTL